MVDNGRARAREYSAARVGRDWQDLLLSAVPELLAGPMRRLKALLPLGLNYHLNRRLQ